MFPFQINEHLFSSCKSHVALDWELEDDQEMEKGKKMQ
jgi:hypothetical protein